MRFPKILAVSCLGFFALVLLLMGGVIGGWLSIFLYVAASGAILVIGMFRKKPQVDWKAYIGVPILFSVLLLLELPSAISSEQNSSIPKFDRLKVSHGLLKDGIGRDYYIVKDDGSNLLLLCADNAGKYLNQTCLDRARNAIGKRVTVYHEPPFKRSRMRAVIYEVRFGGMAIVKYHDIIESINFRADRAKDRSKNSVIMFATFTICSLLSVFIRRRRQMRQGNLHPNDT